VNVISNYTYQKLAKRPVIKPSALKLSAYNGSTIPAKGHCLLRIEHIGNIHHLLFIVVETDSSAILVLNASKQLNLIQHIHEISLPTNDKFYEEFGACFDEIGTLPKTVLL